MKTETNEEKMDYPLMPMVEMDRMNKLNFNSNKENLKIELSRAKEKLRTEIEYMKENIKKLTERAKKKYTPLTQEEYRERIKRDRKRAEENDWKIIEIKDKTNIYSKENQKKERDREKAEFKLWMSGEKSQ